MYRPSVQAVPGAKELLHRPVEPMARHAVRSGRSGREVLKFLNAESAVSRPLSRSRPSAVSAPAGRRRRRARLGNRRLSSRLSNRRTAAASGFQAVPTTRPGG